jgi:hypothetical protein
MGSQIWCEISQVTMREMPSHQYTFPEGGVRLKVFTAYLKAVVKPISPISPIL